MNLKSLKLSFLLLVTFIPLTFVSGNDGARMPIYLNTSYSFEERAADLVSRMTPDEKQSQLGNTMAPIPRLGVNAYNVWGEALHGVMGRNNNSGMTATSFPNSVAAGATWDPAWIEREAEVISTEARGFNHDLIFTLTYWSPVIEPARDPRWGRTAETFGEDPYLVSQIGKGFIRGMMGDHPVYLKTVPCGKHYLANNTEYNRHTGSADMDDRDMREYYLLPYRTLIRDYQLPSIMTAYSAVNGVPVSASKYLVDTIVRKTYGLKGYVTGDCGAIDDMVGGHHYAEDNTQAAALGIISGVDCDCGGVYQNHGLDALEKGLISQGDMDKALIHVFTIRMRTGEFDPPGMVPFAGINPDVINDPSHNELAIELAAKTPVLLKNGTAANTGEKALPICLNDIKKIAVLGPQADQVELGDYSGPVETEYRISPLQGILNYVKEHKPDVEVVSGSGANTQKRTDFFTLIGFSAVSMDGTVEVFDATQFDASSKGLIVSERWGQKSVRGIKDGDWTAYNNIDLTNLDSIRFNMTVSGEGGFLEVRFGSATGNLLASEKIEVIPAVGGNPWFVRPRTIPVKIKTLGINGPGTLVLVYREPEVPATDKETLELAASADVVLIFAGTDQSTGREESDRFSLKLPGDQDEFIKAVAAVNPNTILVMQTMGMVEADEYKNNVNIPGMIWTGYNGQAQGTAIARILFGEVNPGGKLNVTWHKSVNDLPGFDDYTLRGDGTNGRTYWYYDKDVAFEFGYGLSYTSFEYNNFSISKSKITPNDKVSLSVDIRNTGEVDGDEVVQIYVRTPDSPKSFERPIRRLKGFKRVTIPAGQTKTVSIDIACEDLWFWDAEKGKVSYDQGTYIFEFGASSRDIRGQAEAVMEGIYKPRLATLVAESSRSILQPGNTVQSSVTAAMSDDSFYDLTNAVVAFKSNNPSVAWVDDDGKVTAKGVGVASIYAYVTVDGITLSDSYPIKVMPDLTPKSIKVEGKSIKGFSNEVKAYSYLLKNTLHIPAVTASAQDKGISVEIEQAKTVPGTAVVSFVDKITHEKNIFYIHFDVEPVSDDFNAAMPGEQWEWRREDPAAHSLSKNQGSLTITSQPGDVSETTNNARNILLQSANGDWTIETRLRCSRSPSQPENAAIVVYEDDDNFVKLMFRAAIKTTRVQDIQPGTIDLIIEQNGITKSLASFNLQSEVSGGSSLELKLEKNGSLYKASYALEGESFKTLGFADILLKDIKAGLMTCDGTITQNMKSTFWFDPDTSKPDTPFEVAFDYFHIQSKGLK
ncbi:MAG: glycoside hydrolase family 3 C-terminal domain-containing protein [Bacteroidales bacterium]|nr:glycoside hydrolase family 3 C-terminal domain-containing protein [Bacteroidales bacterium]